MGSWIDSLGQAAQGIGAGVSDVIRAAENPYGYISPYASIYGPGVPYAGAYSPYGVISTGTGTGSLLLLAAVGLGIFLLVK